MGDNYDSVLKEKVVYEEPVHTSSIFGKFIWLGVFISLIIIVISYCIYYSSVLSGDVILLNNFMKLFEKYGVILEGFDSKYDLSNSYILDGNVKIDDYKYKYKFIRDGSKLERVFSNNGNSIMYYYDSDDSYIKLSNLEDKYVRFDSELLSLKEYVKDYDSISNGFNNYLYLLLLDSSSTDVFNRLYTIDNYSKIIENIKSNFSNYISEAKIKKDFYFYNGRPVVQVDLNLSTNDINKILGNGDNNLVIKDDISISITTRNDAIINDIKNMKIVINNNSNKSRNVILYDGKDIIYISDKGTKYRYNVSAARGRVMLRTFKNDILYSTLEGYKEKDKYIYDYQVIDEAVKVSLEMDNDSSKYNYNFIINWFDVICNVSIDGVYDNVGAIDNKLDNVSNYRDISDDERKVIGSSIRNILIVNKKE